jgi:hypothetical protein
VQTYRTVPDNEPDNEIRDNKNGTCTVGKFRNRIVITKESEKILKYKDPTIGKQCMWNVKTSAISAITGATGTIPKSFRKYLSDIPGKHEFKELQKTAILGTAHILCKVLL